MKNNKKGFTLIELMIVVAIIGILAAIAIPKFADLINKAKEGSTKGALSSVRSAIQVYYGDNEGWFPADSLACVTLNAKYIAEIPLAKVPGTGHGDSRAVLGAQAATDVAGWLYYNDSTSAVTWGNFVVNCTHEDIKGRGDTAGAATPWSTF
ncbi:MAG: prepilin-type N-terminal cleavage/methylation domain-containing protein [Elusimicrobiota bacterium]|nr:prepilin-type N-terminal cleavage/methylation domain-containing protein [Elusimicrobiota bacterium]